MRLSVLLIAAACTLAGCKFDAGTTTITNVSVDGRRVDATRSNIVDGDGEFDCIKSTTGSCHYVLFVEDCGGDRGDGAGTHACRARVVRSFTLQAGTSRRLTALPPRVRLCVAHDGMPAVPACARTG